MYVDCLFFYFNNLMSFINIIWLILFVFVGVRETTHLTHYGQSPNFPVVYPASFQPMNGAAQFSGRNDEFGSAIDHEKEETSFVGNEFESVDADSSDSSRLQRRTDQQNKSKRKSQQKGRIWKAMSLALILLTTMFVPQIPHNLMIRNGNHFGRVEPQCVPYGRGFKCEFRTDGVPVHSARTKLEIWGDIEHGNSDLLLLGQKQVQECSWTDQRVQCEKQMVIEPDQVDQLRRMSIDEAIEMVLWSDRQQTDSVIGDAQFQQQNEAISDQAKLPYGRLTVQRNKVIGENGQEARLIGVSLFWSQYSDKYWNDESIRKLKCDWHANVIRAPLGVDGYLANPMQEVAKLKRVIEACHKYGVYLIIDWHLTSDDPHTDRAVQFFGAIARSYGHMRNIIYEGWNEAISVSWQQMTNHHRQVIEAIRANDPYNLILCGTPKYDMSLDDVLANPLQLPQIMYTLHWYAADGEGGGNGGDDEFLAQAKDAYSDGLPLFCTEYGLGTGGNTNKPLNRAQAGKWLDWMNANAIPYINWSIYGNDSIDSFPIVQGTTPDTLGNDNQLTEDGQFVKRMIRQMNPQDQCPL